MARGVILFADNDSRFLTTRAEYLENQQYEVLRAFTLEEAQQLLAEAHVQLLILDIRMVDDDDDRDVSGLTLAKDPRYQPVPKIILTGFPTYQAVREALGPILDGLSPAVGFLAKQEGPEALIRAVEDAFGQHVRVDRCLGIRWGRADDLRPAHLVSLVSPMASGAWLSERTAELEDLLRKLFYDYSQITLFKLLSRREGWVLLSVLAYTREGAEEQFVVACGERGEILRAAEQYKLVPHKGGWGATSLTGSAETIHLAATAYRLSGCEVGEVTTFDSFYRAHPDDEVLEAVAGLFEVTLQPWYSKGREKRQRPLEVFYRERLESEGRILVQQRLEGRFDGLSRSALAMGITSLDCSPYRLTFQPSRGAEFTYPNPVPYLAEQRITVSPPTLCGFSHGRLNGASILVGRSGQTWVLDFGRTGVGPLIQDFVSLETSVKLDMLGEVSLAERHILERRLSAMRHLGEEPDTTDVSRGIRKALAVIARIRRQAATVVGPEMEQYLVGLLFSATERFMDYRPELRYTRQELEVLVHVLLLMGMICQRLVAWEDRLQHAPRQAVESLWVDKDNEEAWVEGRRVALTPQGFRLLRYLFEHANQLCKRSDLAREVFDMDYSDLHPSQRKQMEKDTINTAIRRLREDIEPNPSHPKYIRTVRGAGYKLALPHVATRDEV